MCLAWPGGTISGRVGVGERLLPFRMGYRSRGVEMGERLLLSSVGEDSATVLKLSDELCAA